MLAFQCFCLEGEINVKDNTEGGFESPEMVFHPQHSIGNHISFCSCSLYAADGHQVRGAAFFKG